MSTEVVDRARRAGHDVVAVDLPGVAARAEERAQERAEERAGVRWLGAELTALDEVRNALAGVDAVVHLAGLTGPRDAPEPEVHRINVGTTYNVLLAAEEHGIGAVCTASSINAIGGVYSRQPRYDYFPVDEAHPSYCEDSYSLSKWIGEQQSAAFARRRPEAVLAAPRIHGLRRHATDDMGPRDQIAASGWRDLWGWTSFESAAAACLLALRRRFFPGVELRARLPGNAGFYRTDPALAELRWDAHDVNPAISPAQR